jgi:hypothetical protein
MYTEQIMFAHTFQGYTDAIDFLKRIGRLSTLQESLPMDDIVAHANQIKVNQTILTEGN